MKKHNRILPIHYLLVWLCGFSIFISTTTVFSKDVFKCTAEDGSIYFTDTACPVKEGGSVELIDMPETTPKGYDPRSDYYSIENQARRMKEERLERDAIRADLITKRQAIQRLHEAESLREESQKLKDRAGRIKPGELGRTPGELMDQARTLDRKAKMLEKEADILSGTGGSTNAAQDNLRSEEQARMNRLNAEMFANQARDEEIEAEQKRRTIEHEYRQQKIQRDFGALNDAQYNRAIKNCRSNLDANCW